MRDQPANHFMRLSKLGYRRLVPIIPHDAKLSEKSTIYKRLQVGDDARGKAPGLYDVRFKHWFGFDWTKLTKIEVSKWNDWGAGVGIRTGQGLVLIDADTLDKNHARTIKQTIERVAGLCPPIRIGQYPKAGYLVRTDPDFIYTRIEFGERDEKGRLKERVEILAEGRQFVAHGIHPKTKKPYDWIYGLPHFDDLPFLSTQQLHAILEELRPLLPAASEIKTEGGSTSAADVNQDALKGDPALVEKAIRATPNTSEHFPSRESYVEYAYAIKGALQDDTDLARELFLDWCDRWQDGTNDPAIAEADFDRIPGPFKIGAQWLFEKAQALAGEQTFSIAEQWFEPPQAPLFPDSLPNSFNGQGESQKRRFELTPFNDAASTALSTAAAPLIKGVLDQGAMTVLYGESNAGKTFVAMDMAYHIATGSAWCEKRVAKFPVLYIAAEGGQGARKRAAALAARHGPCDGFTFLMHPVNLLRADADLKPLLGTIRDSGLKFGLIVVDTLSRAMAGGDENASTDMGVMVKHLDVLRKATNAHLMVVHHSGKDRAKGARGHSLLRAATDTEIEVANREVMVTKQRDLDGSFSTGFELDVVTLGVDGDGDPVTSCTVRIIGRSEVQARESELTAVERDVLDAVTNLDGLADDKRGGVSILDLTKYYAERGDVTTVNALRQHLKRLVQKGAIAKIERGKWAAKLGEKLS